MLRLVVTWVFLQLITGGDLSAQRYSSAGIGLRIGFSHNADYQASGGSNIALNMSIPSYSIFIYNTFRLQKDSTKIRVFEGLKVLLGGSNRGGLFDVNGTGTRINMSIVDLDLMLPMRVAISRNHNMQMAVGTNIAFKVKQSANTPEVSSFQPGIIFEMGLATMRGSILGFSLSQSFAPYALSNVSLVFGVNVGDIWNSVKMRRGLN